jgi:hypothetical protein
MATEGRRGKRKERNSAKIGRARAQEPSAAVEIAVRATGIAAVALITCDVPVGRSAKVDPMITLRSERDSAPALLCAFPPLTYLPRFGTQPSRKFARA